jgi:hypothetical protein
VNDPYTKLILRSLLKLLDILGDYDNQEIIDLKGDLTNAIESVVESSPQAGAPKKKGADFKQFSGMFFGDRK